MATVIRLPKYLLFTVSLVVAIVTLCLCWWPFNFSPQNDVLVVPEQGTALLNMGQGAAQPDNIGHAYTDGVLQFERDSGATFHLVLTPLAMPKGLGSIVALYDGGRPAPLVIAQWQEHLALFVRAPEAKKGYREVGLRGRLPIGRTVALTVSTSANKSRVFIDGVLAAEYNGFSLLAQTGRTRGRLILGNSQGGAEPWHGSIERVTVHDQALPETVGTQPPGTPVIDHDFARDDRLTEQNQKGAARQFLMPEYFAPLSPTILAPLSRKEFERGSTWRDVAWNILGFVPIGCCLALLAGNIPCSVSRRIGLTVLAAFLFSLLIELGQVFLPSRHSSQLDLLCNTTGALIAASVVRWNVFAVGKKLGRLVPSF